MIFKKKKNKNKPTIQEIEKEIGTKITYPVQIVDDIDLPKYESLNHIACLDVMDKKGKWLHKDCFGKNCKKCNYKTIVEDYNKQQNIEENTPTDFVKANYDITNFFK